MNSGVNPRFYLADVAMPAHQESYVERDADREIIDALRQREYTLLLSSRKVGKSSLLVRTFARLRSGEEAADAQTFLVAKQELGEADNNTTKEPWYLPPFRRARQPGESITEEQWYRGLVNALVLDAERGNPGFVVAPEWEGWWQDQGKIPPGQRFAEFLRKFFLEPTTQPWVIAIDEIDTLLQLPFSDDFFAAVRRCRNARATDPVFGRLVFLLAGVTTPARLIKDNRRTPFNFGRNIALDDFTPEQAKVLLRGLGEPEAADHPALRHILDWTGGHPYLTQTVFKAVAKRRAADKRQSPTDWATLVDEAVDQCLLGTFGTAAPDPQLQDIAERRIHNLSVSGSPNYDPALKRRILLAYRQALRGERLRDDALSPPIIELKICGLLVSNPAEPATLVVRNKVYRTVFDEGWVAEEMPRLVHRRTAQLSLVVTMLVALLAVGAIVLQRQAELRRRIGDLQAQIARADTDVPDAAFTELKAIPGQEGSARELLAAYWAKQARRASAGRPRDEAARLWLKSLEASDQPEARLQARRAWSGSLAQVVTTFRHGGPVQHAAFSPDGRQVVTASADNTARVWDAATGEPVGKPLTHQDWVRHAAFSPDGRQVVTASDDNTARVWDAATGEPVGKPLTHQGMVRHAAFSPDGRVVTQTAQTVAWWISPDQGLWSAEETIWSNGGSWFSAPSLADNNPADCRIADSWTGSTPLLRNIHRGQAEPGLPELADSPGTLLGRYQRRFSLAFAESSEGKAQPVLVPHVPIPRAADNIRGAPRAPERSSGGRLPR